MIRTQPAVRRIDPVPFRHPYFETPRERQREDFRDEIRRAVERADRQRSILATARILEANDA